MGDLSLNHQKKREQNYSVGKIWQNIVSAFVHKNCETAVLSYFNVMPVYCLMHGTERNSTKSSKTIRQPSHSKN